MGTEIESKDSPLILIKQGAKAVSLNEPFCLLNQLAHTRYAKQSSLRLTFI